MAFPYLEEGLEFGAEFARLFRRGKEDLRDLVVDIDADLPHGLDRDRVEVDLTVPGLEGTLAGYLALLYTTTAAQNHVNLFQGAALAKNYVLAVPRNSMASMRGVLHDDLQDFLNVRAEVIETQFHLSYSKLLPKVRDAALRRAQAIQPGIQIAVTNEGEVDLRTLRNQYFKSALRRSEMWVIDPNEALDVRTFFDEPEKLDRVSLVLLELRRFGQYTTPAWAEVVHDFGLLAATDSDLYRAVVAAEDRLAPAGSLAAVDKAEDEPVNDLTSRLLAIGKDPMRNEQLTLALDALTIPSDSVDGRTPFAGLGKRIGLRRRHRLPLQTYVSLSLNKTRRWEFIERALFEVAGLIVRAFGVEGLNMKRLVAMRQLTEVGGVPALTEWGQLEALVAKIRDDAGRGRVMPVGVVDVQVLVDEVVPAAKQTKGSVFRRLSVSGLRRSGR